MTGDDQKLIDEKVRTLRALKDRLLEDGATASELLDLTQRIAAIEEVQRHQPQSPFVRYSYVIFAGIALLLASALWLKPHSENRYTAVVELNRISFTTRDNTSLLLAVTASDARVENLTGLVARGFGINHADDRATLKFSVSAASASPIRLHRIDVPAGSVVTVSSAGPRVEVEVKSQNGVVEGTVSVPLSGSMTVGTQQVPMKAIADAPPESIGFSRGHSSSRSWFRYSTRLIARSVLVQSTAIEQIDMRKRSNSAADAASSVTGGMINLLISNEEVSLPAGVLLDIDGTALLSLTSDLSGTLEAELAGTAGRIDTSIANMTEEHGISYLEYLARNEQLLTFWSCVVFVWVLLRGARQLISH